MKFVAGAFWVAVSVAIVIVGVQNGQTGLVIFGAVNLIALAVIFSGTGGDG